MITPSDSLFGITVFLVDDEYLNLQCFSEVLSDAGYKVRTATNGKFALRSIQQTPPDLVVLDIKMPKMNGYQVYQALQLDERTRNIPVIFMSGVDIKLDQIEDLDKNNIDHLLKPVDIQTLLTRIKQVLERTAD